MDYRVFTWINTDFTRSLTQRLQVSWMGRIITANMLANYQHSWMKNPNSDDLTQAHNWEVRGDITVRPLEGWSVSTNGFYRSTISSLYNKAQDLYSVSARLTKEFKRLTVYLEGQDLLDHKVTTETSSEDMSQLMVQTTSMNRRLFLLGLTWTF